MKIRFHKGNDYDMNPIALHDNVFAQIKAHIEKGTQRDEPGQKRAIF